ncbi:MAG: class I SAM-dependent methyltransferase [Acidobacteriia bacterium]|nr:class I SAM-dependent methyltransferase [Terriglobia bacterium]
MDTTRSNVGVGTQFLAGVMARPYFATEPWLFRQIMQALALSIQQSAISQGNVVPAALQDFTFIDLGSGKGRALLMAAQYGFKRIIGVEFMPELHRVAQENIRKYTAHRTEASPDHLCGTGTPACAAEMVRDEGTDKSVCATKAASIESFCMDALDFEFPAAPLVVYLFNPFSEATFVTVLENLRKSIEHAPRPVCIAYRFTEHEKLLAEAGWLEKTAGTEQWAIYQNHRDRSRSSEHLRRRIFTTGGAKVQRETDLC